MEKLVDFLNFITNFSNEKLKESIKKELKGRG